jgi:phage gp29-like protein
MFDAKSEKAYDNKKHFNYLKYIAEAITADSKNQGSYRKQIWSYLMKNYENKVDYRVFLLVIQRLLKEGKLINRAGIYEVEQTVYSEILED